MSYPTDEELLQAVHCGPPAPARSGAMTLDQYQEQAGRTARRETYPFFVPEYGEKAFDLMTWGLGLTGEAGEVADLLKKGFGHEHGLDREKMAKELGDVLWYVAAIARTLDLDLSEVAQKNVDKLKARYPNGFTPEASRNRKAEP